MPALAAGLALLGGAPTCLSAQVLALPRLLAPHPVVVEHLSLHLRVLNGQLLLQAHGQWRSSSYQLARLKWELPPEAVFDGAQDLSTGTPERRAADVAGNRMEMSLMLEPDLTCHLVLKARWPLGPNLPWQAAPPSMCPVLLLQTHAPMDAIVLENSPDLKAGLALVPPTGNPHAQPLPGPHQLQLVLEPNAQHQVWQSWLLPPQLRPRLSASGAQGGELGLWALVDGDPATTWKESSPGQENWLELNLQGFPASGLGLALPPGSEAWELQADLSLRQPDGTTETLHPSWQLVPGTQWQCVLLPLGLPPGARLGTFRLRLPAQTGLARPTIRSLSELYVW